ncbi:MAG TPA: hypothetical protein VJ922_03025 [Actinomycetota bacterium]|nr:hypothetical protein [Actinomycetota bacterium]
MSRYYVVLTGALHGREYIVAEVARERSDDGSMRELSLAANLAGESATIRTREELEAVVSGRLALRRWETQNDNEFEFDNALLAHSEAATGKRDRSALSKEDLDLLGDSIHERARALTARAMELVEENRLGVERLRETISKHHALKGSMPRYGKDAEVAKRRAGRGRHLRSVS